MLQKAKSKKIWKLKYLFLIPILTAMLFYSSCQNDDLEDSSNTMLVGDIENLAPSEESAVFTKLIALSSGEENWILYVKDSNSKITFSKAPEDSYISGPGNTEIHANMSIDSPVLEEGFDFFKSQGQRPNLVQISLDENAVPFGLVEEVPIFPGCENEADKRGCFNKKMQEHIRKYFNYPKGAQELGIQGRVNIMFTIDQNGNIQNIRKRGPHELLEGEAVRIIERLPEMKPGKLKGKAVNVPFSIPISFKLK
jgi:TonB family protein